MDMALKFESIILAQHINQGAPTTYKGRVTVAKTFKYPNRSPTCSHSNHTGPSTIVRRYHIKLVGWSHNKWANPSDLKGGAEALETLAEAVNSGSCRFVRIDKAELEDRKRCTQAGKILTPDQAEQALGPSACSSSSTSPTSPSSAPAASMPATSTPAAAVPPLAAVSTPPATTVPISTSSAPSMPSTIDTSAPTGSSTPPGTINPSQASGSSLVPPAPIPNGSAERPPLTRTAATA
ncbi:hypothetical protein BJ138DRAFT_1119291 [Hygrophoropsis aurantiaca]|uniref:Uncharacterized protein n=1 Tax=Hygrophoropsis aurantiaca TaxID=72124 RepID=A0ACB7ZUN5_9AGAM|nr:hypothetical protein BJ138DRAFT_1119291 [Hygrophoropsis aurantiaca]